ncbi:hypothetical protein [Jiangella alkaliphila]|uniref:Uncharacterized protein n=1 Tax=Jiangella alkaliphila TaxID=419479 RepID=A0A1H2L7V1_9ACTN|nr:hypothetical protein [Jiangella alkaliphila]SDU77130.1 hypothetical protein SAMN04488563_5429 [Jiangella alkaliphila]
MSADHVTNASMTIEEKAAQLRQDEGEALAFIGRELLEAVGPDRLIVAGEVLEALRDISLAPLSGKIEHDGHGNPLYTYGARMVWSKAHDVTEEAGNLVRTIARALASAATTPDRRP